MIYDFSNQARRIQETHLQTAQKVLRRLVGEDAAKTIITFGLYANMEGPDGKISAATGLKLETGVITPERGEPPTIPHAEYQ